MADGGRSKTGWLQSRFSLAVFFLVSVTTHFFLYRPRKIDFYAIFWIDSATTV
jgi:hypothetical protein